MESLMYIFDITLGLGLIWLAWQVTNGRDIFKSIVLFIVFGLLVAMAWVRMKAPDIALAEAAIGAGITGALLLITLRRVSGEQAETAPAQPPDSNGEDTISHESPRSGRKRRKNRRPRS